MKPQPYPDLSEVKSPTVDTRTAARYLNRTPDTLRVYARSENPPIKPLRFAGRYLWKVEDIRKVTGASE